MDRSGRLARIGAAIALILNAILVIRVIAIGNPEALAILAPAIAGGVLALALPRSRTALIGSAVLVLGTVAFSLIGYWGLLYVPSAIALIAAAAASRSPSRAT